MRTEQRLTILNVAYPLATVSCDSIGGAEQVVSQLDAALTLAGHNSIVIASESSKVCGTLFPTPAWIGTLNDDIQAAAAKTTAAAITSALKRWPVDLIHLHGIDFHRYLDACAKPALATLHLPTAWYPPSIFSSSRPATFYNCVSATQQAGCPACPQLLPHIANGVSLDRFRARHAKRHFTVALGRICSEKGFHIALSAAKIADIPLLLAGRVYGYADHEAYFAREILPRLDEGRIFIGAAGITRKRRLLAAAQCLLAPSLVAETSSLVAMEALACGTPIVAFPAGALAEIVEHGKTGFLVRDEAEMAAAIHECGHLSPDDCRNSARQRFDSRLTIEKYLNAYELIAAFGDGAVRRMLLQNASAGGPSAGSTLAGRTHAAY
jgi:glycosyltransferase involved in cell wall biosynthesis